jgi:hypothetical protein
MNLIDAFNDNKGAEAFADLHPNRVDLEKAAELQKTNRPRPRNLLHVFRDGRQVKNGNLF